MSALAGSGYSCTDAPGLGPSHLVQVFGPASPDTGLTGTHGSYDEHHPSSRLTLGIQPATRPTLTWPLLPLYHASLFKASEDRDGPVARGAQCDHSSNRP